LLERKLNSTTLRFFCDDTHNYKPVDRDGYELGPSMGWVGSVGLDRLNQVNVIRVIVVAVGVAVWATMSRTVGCFVKRLAMRIYTIQ